MGTIGQQQSFSATTDLSGDLGDIMKWPFDQPRNCATVFSKSVLNRSRPILLVSHDEDDHGWQFLDGVSEELEDVALAGLGHVLEIDPAIVQLAELAPGFQAARAGLEEQWIIERTPPDENEDED
jgi:hypothetical protein